MKILNVAQKSLCLSIVALTTITAYSAELANSGLNDAKYMSDSVELVAAPNGAIINAEVLKITPQYTYTEPTIDKVAEGLWVIGGYSVANTAVIETDEGLIIYDTGDSREEGEKIREAIKSISDKPIKAIIYSHSHYTLGAGAFVDDPDDVIIIGHSTLNETVENNLQSGGVPSAIPEVGPILTARTVSHFGLLLPDEGPDAAVSGKLDLGKPIAFLPANKTVENAEVIDVLGLKMQFFTENVSDDYSLTVYVPEKGLILNNFFWPGTPNLYSLRGAIYRSPLAWVSGLKVIRDLQPSILVNTHAIALKDKDQITDRLSAYIDKISITYDQTLRGILKGMGPDELRSFVQFPEYLADTPENFESYGESVHFYEAVYQYVIGWFDWDVTKLFAIHPVEAAERTVALMGGKDKVINATKDALDKNEFAWAAELIQYVYLLDPLDKEVRQLKADTLRQLGYRATGSIPRGFLLSEALMLEGKIPSPLTVMPSPEIVAAAPDVFVDFYRIRIDVQKSQDTDRVIQFTFTDDNIRTVALHVRKGVVEFIPVPSEYLREADISIELSASTWASIYLGSSNMALELEENNISIEKGDELELISIFAMFDQYDPANNFKVPPL